MGPFLNCLRMAGNPPANDRREGTEIDTSLIHIIFYIYFRLTALSRGGKAIVQPSGFGVAQIATWRNTGHALEHDGEGRRAVIA
jgi:hypothetical protein